jgi:hypothetical protein
MMKSLPLAELPTERVLQGGYDDMGLIVGLIRRLPGQFARQRAMAENVMKSLVPQEGLEPPTPSLRMKFSHSD